MKFETQENVSEQASVNLERLRWAKEELLKKIQLNNDLNNHELLIHGTHSYQKIPGSEPDKPFYLLKSILESGLLTPEFIKRADKGIDNKNDITKPIKLIRPAKNPHNESWVSLLKNSKESKDLAAGYAEMKANKSWGLKGWFDIEEGSHNSEQERYVFICDPKIKVIDLDNEENYEKIKTQHRSTTSNVGEQLRFARVAPRFFKGLIIPDNAQENKLISIINTMREIFKENFDKYLPVYDFKGNLLWPKVVKKENGDIEIEDLSIEKILKD